jgi:hypothetical protein
LEITHFPRPNKTSFAGTPVWPKVGDFALYETVIGALHEVAALKHSDLRKLAEQGTEEPSRTHVKKARKMLGEYYKKFGNSELITITET